MEQLTYLTGKLDSSVDYAEEIANRMNKRGLKPSRSEAYTATIVKNVVYGRSSDKNIKLEILKLLAEQEEKTDLVNKHIQAAEALLIA